MLPAKITVVSTQIENLIRIRDRGTKSFKCIAKNNFRALQQNEWLFVYHIAHTQLTHFEADYCCHETTQYNLKCQQYLLTILTLMLSAAHMIAQYLQVSLKLYFIVMTF